MEEENKGITLKDIFRTIWIRKWVALIVAVAVALVCAISLFYGYNQSATNYVMEFSLSLPGDDSGVVYTYPNGSQLYYADMTSVKTLRAIKSANEEAFGDIDVETMATKGRISIERNIKALVDDTGTTSAYKDITYTITAKASCFSNTSQAINFLSMIAETPINDLRTMEIDYGVYLGNFENVDNYEKELELLTSQLDMLTKGYAALIGTYGDGVVIKDGRTLYAYAHNVELYVGSNEIKNLLTRVQKEYLVKNDDCKAEYELELERVNKQLKDANTTLETLLNSDKAYTDGASVIKAQQDLVNELTRRKDLVEGYTTGTVDASFENEVKKAYDEVERLTQEYSETSKTVYKTASSAVYLTPGIVEKTGGMGLTKILLLSVVLAVIVALIAAYVAGYLALKKKKESEATPTEQPSQETQATENELKE